MGVLFADQVLIAKSYWDSSHGLVFYDIKSVTTGNISKFMAMAEELGYKVLLVGNYAEQAVPSYSEKEIINFYLEGEKEYGDCFKREADIIRKYKYPKK